MRRIGEHAVVIGASMAGLVAARALADAYERVTVVDRDALPGGGEGRARGAAGPPRARAARRRAGVRSRSCCPGSTAELRPAGAPTYAALTRAALRAGRPRLARAPIGLRVAPRRAARCSRATSAAACARCANVELRRRAATSSACDRDDGGERVTGVRLLRRAGRQRRGGAAAPTSSSTPPGAARGPRWLEALGYAAPAEERLDVDVTYATPPLRLRRRRAGRRPRSCSSARRPEPPRHGVPVRAGGRPLDRRRSPATARRPPAAPTWTASLASRRRVAPPGRRARRSRAAEPLDEVATHRFPASVRRRYERCAASRRACSSFGDALCSFNPIYGQGMTVAAREALALRDCLADGARRPRRGASSPPRARGRPRLEARAGRRPRAARVAGARPLRVRADQRLPGPPARGRRARPGRGRRFIAVAGHDRSSRRTCCVPPGARVLAGPRGPRRRRGRRPRRSAVRQRASWRRRRPHAAARGGPARGREAVVFLHGNPGSGADWEPLLAAVGAGRRALAWDAPGFGRAARRPASSQTVDAHAAFIGRALDALGDRAALLVLHDFGGPWGLAWAAGDPERFAGAVLLGTGVLPGYRWHALARVWRTPLLGELFMATTTRRGFRPCCGAATRAGCRARSSTACTTTSTATRGAPSSPSTARSTSRARASALRRGAAPARPPRARRCGAARPVPPVALRRAPARGVPERRDPRARAQRPLAVRRRPRHRHRGADRLPRPGTPTPPPVRAPTTSRR